MNANTHARGALTIPATPILARAPSRPEARPSSGPTSTPEPSAATPHGPTSELEPALRRVDPETLELDCPACGRPHQIRATESGEFDEARGHWQWNRDAVTPSFWPSLLVEGVHDGQPFRCHSWIKLGLMVYLPDSTHSMRTARLGSR